MVEADAGLAKWIRQHRFLRPVPGEEGESEIALLFLWDVDHGCSLPSLAGDSQASLLKGFTRRLKDRWPKTRSCESGWPVNTCRCPWPQG